MSIQEIYENTMHPNLPVVDVQARLERMEDGEFAGEEWELLELDGRETLVLHRAAKSVLRKSRAKHHWLEAADTAP